MPDTPDPTRPMKRVETHVAGIFIPRSPSRARGLAKSRLERPGMNPSVRTCFFRLLPEVR